MVRRALILALGATILGTGCQKEGIRGSYPGPDPQWDKVGGTYCAYCGGGESVSVWASGKAGAGITTLGLSTEACIDGADGEVGDHDMSASLTHQIADGPFERIEAVTGSYEVHRCDSDEDHPYADVSFELEFEDGAEVSGRITTPLEYDRGAE